MPLLDILPSGTEFCLEKELWRKTLITIHTILVLGKLAGILTHLCGQ